MAQSLGVTTDKSTAALTSILPRSCKRRNIKFPDLAPNAGILLIKDRSATEMTRLLIEDAYPAESTLNDIPLIGIKLQSSVNNALVDIDLVVG